jgi:hypothetical protein
MSRQTRKPAAPKEPVKRQTADAMMHDRARGADNPFVIFSEWSSAADEKAYAGL